MPRRKSAKTSKASQTSKDDRKSDVMSEVSLEQSDSESFDTALSKNSSEEEKKVTSLKRKPVGRSVDSRSVDSRKKAKRSGGKVSSQASSENGKETEDGESSDEKEHENQSDNTKTQNRKSSQTVHNTPKSAKRSEKKKNLGKSSSQKSNENGEESGEESTDDQAYEVAEILEFQFRKDGNREFLVRWKGYTAEDDTWESEARLNCKELIDKFMLKVEKNSSEEEKKATSLKRKPVGRSVDSRKKAKRSGGKVSSQASSENGKETEDGESSDEKEHENQSDNTKKPDRKSSQTVHNTPKSAKRSEKKKNLGKSSSQKSNENGEESGEESTDDQAYEVAKILEVHFRKDGNREFLVRWKGYTAEDDTWEPEAHLNCKELIDKFMLKVEKAKHKTPRDEVKRSVRENPKTSVVVAHRMPGLRYTGFRPFYQE